MWMPPLGTNKVSGVGARTELIYEINTLFGGFSEYIYNKKGMKLHLLFLSSSHQLFYTITLENMDRSYSH